MDYNIEWDAQGEHFYETGTDRGVLYPMNEQGEYGDAEAWNGLTSVDESPSGAEAEKIYADNGVYLTLLSAEEFGGTINAYTYPDGFKACNGEADLGGMAGVVVGQQKRSSFGFSYRSRKGNDVNEELGNLIHLWYGCKASPSEKSYSTVNDSPEAIEFSWEVTTTPIEVPEINGVKHRKTSQITIDTTKLTSAQLTALEQKLYGTPGTESYTSVTIESAEDFHPDQVQYYTRTGSSEPYTYTRVSSDAVYDSSATYYVKTTSGGTKGSLPSPSELYNLLNP